jgi:integrase
VLGGPGEELKESRPDRGPPGLPLVFVRPGGLRKAEWAEFNLTDGEWRISAAKMKMRRPHRVPLAGANSGHSFASLGDRWLKYLFSAVRSWHRPISDNTLNAALRRPGHDKTDLTAYGLRSTASVQNDRWQDDAFERQLVH